MRLNDATDLTEHPRCAACGERIGVYEPIVNVTGTTVSRTSLAMRPAPHVTGLEPRLFHVDCYETG